MLPPAERAPIASGLPLGRFDGEDPSAEVAAAGEASRTWRRLRRDPAFWIGAAIAIIIIGAAMGADQLAPYDPNLQIRDGGLTAEGAPQPPSDRFPLGTDKLGRDYYSRLLHGARTSLAIGIGAALAASLVGAVVGAVAAFAGTVRLSARVGRRRFQLGIPVESILMRLTDIVLSLPRC